MNFEPYDVLLKLAPRYWAVKDEDGWKKYCHFDRPKQTAYATIEDGFYKVVGPFYEEADVEKFIKEIR